MTSVNGQVFGRAHSDRPPFVIRNTFLDIDDGSNWDRAQRRNKTVPGSFLTAHDEESPISTSCDREIDSSDAVRKACEESTCDSSSSSRERSPSEAALRGSVWERSRETDGAWIVQQAFDIATSEEDRCKLARELEGHVVEAAQDLNANFVLQKMVMVMHTKSLEFVVDEIRSCSGGTCIVASNRYGCRVIQRLLEYCSASLVAGIVDDLLAHAVFLSSDRYAKYAMQCLLEHGAASQVRHFMQLLTANAGSLSVDMQGVSVIGKALSTGPPDERVLLANEISAVPGLIKQISRSKQGHYVIKLITKMKGETGTSDAVSFCLDNELQQPILMAGTGIVCKTKSSAPTKHRRRGKGGGSAAQDEAEIRDLVSSLDAACRRGCPDRVTQALCRAQAKLETPGVSPALIARLVQAYGLAQEQLNSLR